MINILIYALLWISFGATHSLLTLPAVKSRLPANAKHTYRFAYNLFAAAHFFLIYRIGRALLDHSLISSDTAGLIFNMLNIAGFVVIYLALLQYDLGLFSGLSQLFKKPGVTSDAIEPLNTSGLNRWVRHPLYSGAFMYLWGGANSQFGFWTALFGSLYILIGVRHEEKKLMSIYGGAYLNYQASVSAFFPLKWQAR